MEKMTKRIVVNGQEMVMSSLDGRSWFLKPESMYDFESRSRQGGRIADVEFEEIEEEPAELALPRTCLQD